MEHRLFIATLISTGIVIFGINHVSAQLTPSEETTYFDDFSSYTPGSPPSGWILRGADQVIPTVKDVGGTGPSHRLVDFPEVPWQYWGRTLLKDGLIPRAPYTVMVKLNFQHKVADRAGLTIAWNDNSNYVEIQPNIYGNDIEFRPEYNGPIHSNLKVNSIGHIPISPFTNYWLRVEVKDDRPGQGQLSVLWSTDGTNFIQVMSATGLQNLRGLVGVSTAGPHLPHVYFDDFSVSALTEGGVQRVPGSAGAPSTPKFGIQQTSSSDISNAYKITTNVSCDTQNSSKVIYTFNDNTKADFVALLESTDPDESSELRVSGETYLFTPVIVKYPQVVNQAEFTANPGDKLLACINGTNGDEQAVIWLRVLKSSFAQLPQRVEFFVSAYKCSLSAAGVGVPVAVGQAILDFYNGDMSAFQILQRDLPTPYRSCTEWAAKL